MTLIARHGKYEFFQLDGGAIAFDLWLKGTVTPEEMWEAEAIADLLALELWFPKQRDC